jgi:hypothetical protein
MSFWLELMLLMVFSLLLAGAIHQVPENNNASDAGTTEADH